MNPLGLMTIDKAGHVSLCNIFLLVSEGDADLVGGVASAHDLSARTLSDTDPFRPIDVLIDEVLREHLCFRRQVLLNRENPSDGDMFPLCIQCAFTY